MALNLSGQYCPALNQLCSSQPSIIHSQLAAWHSQLLLIHLQYGLFICCIYFSSCSFMRCFSQLFNYPTHNLFPKPFKDSSGPLLALSQADFIVLGFFYLQILHLLSVKRWSPVGERWRYIGNSSVYCALLCDLASFATGHTTKVQ